MSNLVFVSYSRADTAFVKRLIDDLLQQGVDIWLDQREIAAGQRWDRTIQEALQACGTFIIILSPNSVASENVQDEISYTINANKRIIPILLRDCEIPYRMARIQFIDFRSDYAQGFQLLYSEITHRPIQRTIKTRKQADPWTIATWLVGLCLVFVACLALGMGGYFIYKYSPSNRAQSAPTVTPVGPSEMPLPPTSILVPDNVPVNPTSTPASFISPTVIPVNPTFAPPWTASPEAPHAPPIVNNFGVPLYDEHQKLITVKSGEQVKFSVMNDLWSGPEGSAPSCASGFLALTWIVRDPYPTGGEDLQLLRLIPMGDGRTEVFASGWRGSTTLEYCGEVFFFNNSLRDYRVEINYASGIH